MKLENKYTVNEISKKYKLSIRTLQYYDEMGILSVKRLPNGYRYYTQKDLYTLDSVVILKNYGLSLSIIKYYLYEATLEEQKKILLESRRKKDEELKNITIAIENIDSRMKELTYLKDIEIDKILNIEKNQIEYELLPIEDFKMNNEYFNTPIDNKYMVSVFSSKGDLSYMARPINETNKKIKYIYAYYEYHNNFKEILNKFIQSLKEYNISYNLIYTYPILLEQNKYLHYFEVQVKDTTNTF